MGWIQTYTGKRFDPLAPDPSSIDIEDIAHALSNICRFTGHVAEFFSVAQHSVIVSMVVPEEDAMHGLLHDASEAYICDIAKPIKSLPGWEPYRAIEHRLQRAIYDRFGLGEEPASIKQADYRMLVTEACELMSPMHPDWFAVIEQKARYDGMSLRGYCWSPTDAKATFLRCFHALSHKGSQVTGDGH